jgi:hypothetical protein
MAYTFNWADCDSDAIIWGQLADGTYFLGHNFDEFDHTVWLFDIDPYENYLIADDNDGIDDFVECYSIGEISNPNNYQFWEECLDFIDENPNPSSSTIFDWVEVIDPQYAIFGQLTDGTYFMAGGYRFVDEEEPMVVFTDINPEEYYDLDDNEDQWESEHIIKELQHPENLEFWDTLVAYCEDNGLWI